MPANNEFSRPDGGLCPAYYVDPNKGVDAPSIIVIQEWWGINQQIERVADHLAASGYRVLVPDLYRGERALDAAEAEHKMDALDFSDALTQDIGGAIMHLAAPGSRVATLGFCMGGVLSMLAAMNFSSQLSAAVAWYGLPPDEAGDPGEIRIPLQAHFGNQDQMFPPDAVDAFENKLRQAGVDYEFHRYDADHAFGNEEWDNYNEAASKKAWQRSEVFLEKHLFAD